MPLRPGWGSLGRPGQVRTNFFAVKIPKDAVYHEYEIEISPKAQAKGDRRPRILELVEQSPAFSNFTRHVAHDKSQRLVSARPLPQPLSVPIRYLEVDQEDNPQAMVFTVEFKFQRELSLSTLNDFMSGKPEHRGTDTQPYISALNLVVQSFASKRGVRVGGNKYFFPSSDQSFRLSLGVEAYRGFFMSIRPMYKQLMVNINVCMTAFYTPGNLAQAMMEFTRQTNGAMPQQFADKLKVATKHLGYTKKHTIARIMTSLTANKARFQCDELGGEVTVEEFFKRKYKITLRHARDLPVINVSTNRKRPVYLPVEICEIIPGQAYRGKLDGEQTAQMIRFACNPPDFNGNAITQQGFERLGLRPGTAPVLNEFGLSVDPHMAVVPSRVLPPPSITYKAGRPRIQNAGWNIVDIKLQTGGSIASWAVLLVNEGRRDEFRNEQDPQLIDFLKIFLRKCESSGISGANKPPKILSVNLPSPRDDPNRERALEAIRQVLRDKLNRNAKPSFILVLLSGVDKYIYPGIKRLGDVEMGLHTVHMLLEKARDTRGNRQDQYFSNVVLKVNAKLGGINHILDSGSMRWLTEKKTMVMGIDVTHPSPKSLPGSPSIAAVVASVDDNFVQFPASLSLQKPDWNKESKEMVEKLTEMTIERLQLYQKRNGGRLPDRIFVYRDGVSEGQYHLVLQHELGKIQAAFKQISPRAPYKPALTIAICGKRHHARFWPTASGDMTNNGNTVPGTVVDRGITDVYNFDFYLQAHNGLQGHVRPTHYTVIYDENHYGADVLQQGTHTASYLYARATKAVSLVPAAYYADIACERGRDYLNVLMNLIDDRSSVAAGTSTADKEAEKQRVYDDAVKKWGKGVHPDLKESMFYI
ncbi:Piwi-domain-containing protein [Cubamyces menziesii]|nr:Piwi-domain-containing protein [Cubamyces menziesii]